MCVVPKGWVCSGGRSDLFLHHHGPPQSRCFLHDPCPACPLLLQAANPFPAAYRSQGLILDVLPVLNQHKSSELATITNRQPSKEPGQELFAQLLLKASSKVTVIATGEDVRRPQHGCDCSIQACGAGAPTAGQLSEKSHAGADSGWCDCGRCAACQRIPTATDPAAVQATYSGLKYRPGSLLMASSPSCCFVLTFQLAAGPLSNLAYALETYPTQIADKIERVWWMGGALRVKGNVYEPRTDGSAEWNSYWDPAAAGVVWRSNVPLTLVPLDGTNKVHTQLFSFLAVCTVLCKAQLCTTWHKQQCASSVESTETGQLVC